MKERPRVAGRDSRRLIGGLCDILQVAQRVMSEARKPEGLDVGFVGNDNEIGSSLPCLQRREQVGEVGE